MCVDEDDLAVDVWHQLANSQLMLCSCTLHCVVYAGTLPQRAAPARPWERQQQQQKQQQPQQHQHQRQQFLLMQQAVEAVQLGLKQSAQHVLSNLNSSGPATGLGQLFVPAVLFLAAAVDSSNKSAATGELFCSQLLLPQQHAWTACTLVTFTKGLTCVLVMPVLLLSYRQAHLLMRHVRARWLLRHVKQQQP